eukprot:6344897-Prymnesium_polylepis.1
MSCRHTRVGQDCGLRGAVCWTVDWGAGVWWDMLGHGEIWRDMARYGWICSDTSRSSHEKGEPQIL